MTGLQGKIALVSGAGSGIGRATALALAQRGAKVLCTDRDGTAALALADELGAPAAAMALDVTSPDDWHSAVESLHAQHGRLDILVNAAGISHASALINTTLDDWRRVMAVNVEGVLLGTQAAARIMLPQATGGCMVHVASLSGLKSAPGAALYCASKAAVIHFCRTAGLELRRQNPRVRVNAISPAGVRTPLWRTMPFFQNLIREHGSEDAAFAALSASSEARRFAEAAEVAAAITYLVSDDARYLGGVNFVFDDGGSA